MSVNIQLHIEAKIRGVWYHYNHPSRCWDTQLYALMAGVGNHPAKPLFRIKELPSNITMVTMTHLSSNIMDAHHSSWLSSQAVEHLAEQYHKIVQTYT